MAKEFIRCKIQKPIILWGSSSHPDRKAQVYVLINPINNKLFYVGSTRLTLAETLGRHMRPNVHQSPEKRKIMAHLRASGVKAIIKSVHLCTVSDRFKKEKIWRHKLAKKHMLTNACGIK